MFHVIGVNITGLACHVIPLCRWFFVCTYYCREKKQQQQFVGAKSIYTGKDTGLAARLPQQQQLMRGPVKAGYHTEGELVLRWIIFFTEIFFFFSEKIFREGDFRGFSSKPNFCRCTSVGLTKLYSKCIFHRNHFWASGTHETTLRF